MEHRQEGMSKQAHYEEDKYQVHVKHRVSSTHYRSVGPIYINHFIPGVARILGKCQLGLKKLIQLLFQFQPMFIS